jgi:hypothetical protein
LCSHSRNSQHIKKNTQTLIDASKEVGLEVNTEKTKYMLLSRHQNLIQNHDIKIGNRCFDNGTQFKYLETTVTNQNLIQEEISRDRIRIMLATVQSRTLCLAVCCLNRKNYNTENYNFACVSVRV